jgi:hypothetical protein
MFERITRIFRSAPNAPAPTPTPTGKPKGYAFRGTDPGISYFAQRKRNTEILKKYQTIYNQGGIVAEAIDAYALYVFAPGYEIVSDDDGIKEDVEARLDEMEFIRVAQEGIISACVLGDAFQENVFEMGGRYSYTRNLDASTFDILFDILGSITGYRQVFTTEKGATMTADFSPDEITHLTLFSQTASPYGQSLIGRAYDDIMRDTKIMEGTATAIERHGHPKHDITVGTGDPNEIIGSEMLEEIGRNWATLKSKQDFVHTASIKIGELDKAGVLNANEYNNFSIQRICTALGVPEEILGLGRGSTEATAKVRLRTFYKKISALQMWVANCYNKNVIDKITGIPGQAKIEFNEIEPEDYATLATWIASLRTGIDPDAVCPADWCREQFGIPLDQIPQDQTGGGQPGV